MARTTDRTSVRASSIEPVRPGARHESWPWYLRAGMIVHLNHPDSREPLGRIWGAVVGGPRDGQPAYLPLDESAHDGREHRFNIAHPFFLLPCPPRRREDAERFLRAVAP